MRKIVLLAQWPRLQLRSEARRDELSWWDKATTEQKLAQIDGGIECGMTARQVAMASRANFHAVRHFAAIHGRHFPNDENGKRPSDKRRQSMTRDRNAYMRGERVNLWGGPDASDGFVLDEVEG